MASRRSVGPSETCPRQVFAKQNTEIVRPASQDKAEVPLQRLHRNEGVTLPDRLRHLPATIPGRQDSWPVLTVLHQTI